jgi:hypothetical protein
MRKVWSGIGMLAACAALIACGDETASSEGGTSTQGGSTSTGAGGAGGGGEGGMGGAGGGSGGMGGAGGGGGGSAGTCPAESICLALKPTEGGPVEAGRVVVVWYQFNDDGPDPLPLIAYDEAFDPKTGEIQIPIAGIAQPNPENMLCERSCDDEAMCPCLNELQVGVGFVFAVRDTDMSGSINFDEIGMDMYGIGYMGVGYSEQERIPAPAPLNSLFSEGIDKGIRPYRIIEGGTFDDLGRTKPGDVLNMNICNAPSATCAPPFPNLT